MMKEENKESAAYMIWYVFFWASYALGTKLALFKWHNMTSRKKPKFK